jgi:c-di-GMP-binding flagellar brake protein YcgR
VGGCALRVPDLTAPFRRGQRLPGVSFSLDPHTAFACEVLVRHVNQTTHGLRLGCEMLNLDGSVERALQRCVDQTQKRQRWAQALI